MQISQTQNGDVTVAKLNGRLDSGTAPAAEKQLLEMVAAGASRLALDCSALEYVSSAGLRVILSLAKRISGVSGQLALAAPTQQVREILDIAGFSDILQICASADEAVAACAK